MIYLVSRNRTLFNTTECAFLPFNSAINILLPLKEVQIDTETMELDCHTKALLTLQLGCSDYQIVFD